MTLAFLYGHAFDIGWGLLTALIGALIGLGLEWLLGRNRSPQPSVIQQTIVIQTVRPARTSTKRRSDRLSPIVDEQDRLLLGFIVAGATVAGYLRWRYEISLGLTTASLALFGLSAGMVAYATIRVGVRRAEMLVPLVALAIVIVGFLDGRALARPSFARGRYGALLRAFDHGGLTQVTRKYGAEGLFFVFYQVIGVAFLALADTCAIVALFFVLGRVNVQLNARGGTIWRLFDRGSRRTNGGPAAVIAFAAALALISYPMCSGAAYNLIHRFATHTSPSYPVDDAQALGSSSAERPTAAPTRVTSSRGSRLTVHTSR